MVKPLGAAVSMRRQSSCRIFTDYYTSGKPYQEVTIKHDLMCVCSKTPASCVVPPCIKLANRSHGHQTQNQDETVESQPDSARPEVQFSYFNHRGI